MNDKNSDAENKIIKELADSLSDLSFYDYPKTIAKYQKIAKEEKGSEFPFLCPKHIPYKDYSNITHDYVNFDGSKVNNYLCTKCYLRTD